MNIPNKQLHMCYKLVWVVKEVFLWRRLYLYPLPLPHPTPLHPSFTPLALFPLLCFGARKSKSQRDTSLEFMLAQIR